MNLRQDPLKHEVSVYVEGIGTINFEDDQKTKPGQPDLEVGNDDRQGYAFGSGPTGIRDKVTKGINLARKKILKQPAYIEKKEFIQKIMAMIYVCTPKS